MNAAILLLTLLIPSAMDSGAAAQSQNGLICYWPVAMSQSTLARSASEGMLSHPCWRFGLVSMGTASTIALDADESVTSGGKALKGGWTAFPWYDAEADDVRRVDVASPQTSGGDGSNAFGKFITSLLQALAWCLIAALLAGVVYLLWQAFLRREARGPLDRDEPLGTADRVDALPLPADARRGDLLAEARRQYEAGNFAQAIIYFFSFQLMQLDRHQIIRLELGKTNRQYLREVGPRHDLRGLVEQTMLAFEDVFFGHHALDRARFDACWGRLGEFETLTQ